MVIAPYNQARRCCGRVVLPADDVGVGLELLGLGQLVQEVVCSPGLGVVVEAILHGSSVSCAEGGLKPVDRDLSLVDDHGVHCDSGNVDDCGAAVYYQY